MRLIVMAFILWGLLVPAFSTQAQQNLDRTLSLDGFQRQYLVHLPPDYAIAKKLPVIFALHGGGGTYKNTIGFYHLDPLADQYGFIIVYPNAVNKSWSMKGISGRVKGSTEDIDDVHFISVLIDTLAAHYKADPKNIFCTGISRGGIFSLYLADHLSNRIAAIAPVCAGIPTTVAANYTFSHPTPVLLINGTADPLISFTGGAGKYHRKNENEEDYNMIPTEELVKKIAALNKCDEQPEATKLPDIDKWDGCNATRYAYSCNKTPTIFIKIEGGGHTWPGGKQYLPKFLIGNVCRDFKAEDEIIRFFRKVMASS